MENLLLGAVVVLILLASWLWVRLTRFEAAAANGIAEERLDKIKALEEAAAARRAEDERKDREEASKVADLDAAIEFLRNSHRPGPGTGN